MQNKILSLLILVNAVAIIVGLMVMRGGKGKDQANGILNPICLGGSGVTGEG